MGCEILPYKISPELVEKTREMARERKSPGRTPESHLNVTHDLFDVASFGRIREDAEALQDTLAKGKSELPTFPAFLEDAFYSLFKYVPGMKPPEEVKPTYQLNRNLLQEMTALPEYEQLRQHTKLDEVQAASATAVLGETILAENAEEIADLRKYLYKLQQAQERLAKITREQKRVESQMKVPNLTPQQLQQLAEQYQTLQQKEQQQAQAVMKAQKQTNLCAGAICAGTAMRNATKQALDTAQLQEELLGGWGEGAGTFKPVDYKDRLRLSQQILKNKKLLEIARLAGRFSRLAARKQKMKTKHSVEEISDIIQSNDLGRVLPSEVVLLVVPELELLFYKKYAERELLTYELTGEEVKGKGPIICCIDVSGSMGGERDTWCKAVALALIQVAHREKRNAIVIPFDHVVQTAFEFYKDDYSVENLLKMASYFTGGGTNFDPPLKASMRYLEAESKLKKADVVVVTDGEASLSAKVKEDFLDLKEKLKFSLITIVIGSEFGMIEHSLKPVSDHLYPVEQLDESLAGDIFESV